MMKITKHAAAAAAGVLVLLAAQSLVASAGAEDPGTSGTHIHTCAGYLVDGGSLGLTSL